MIHVIFGTKDRRPLISQEFSRELYSYLGSILVANKCPPAEINGTADHVHVLFELNRTSTIADVLEDMKSSSSKWLKTKGIHDFAWQTGYGAFSVSVSNIDAVRNYIANQESHHRTMSFEEELGILLRRHGIEGADRDPSG